MTNGCDYTSGCGSFVLLAISHTKNSCVTWVSLQLPPHLMSAISCLCKLSIPKSPEYLVLVLISSASLPLF